MKKLFFTISLLILIGIFYFSMVNYDSETSIIISNNVQHTISLSYIILGTLIVGFVTGSGIIYLFLDAEKTKVKAYKRELEKTSISGTNNASKVEILEAKIKTLEKAFETVVDERTKLEIQIKNLNTEIENLNKNR